MEILRYIGVGRGGSAGYVLALRSVPAMNFFGHATVACMRSDEPRFVLGSMLPDLTSMAQVRIESVLDPELARGVALHHETDRVFHAAPPFRALCEDALAVLEREGVSRASARAVGHVGSELLLDGLLSDDRSVRAAYARALETAIEKRFEHSMTWRGDADAASLRKLLERLAGAPLPEGYRDPAFVYDRLHTILARRPRLALQPRDREPVQRWLQSAALRLQRDAAVILDALRSDQV
jgi:hypothetical protein